jgi:hypothetical protein
MAQQKRIKRGEFVRLPNGAGSIAIGKEGAVIFRPAVKNPTAAKRKRTAPKAKQPGARVAKALKAWVRSQLPKKKTRRTVNPIGRRKAPAKKRSK